VIFYSSDMGSDIHERNFSTDAVLTWQALDSELYGVDFGSSSNVTTGNGYTFLEDPFDGGTVPFLMETVVPGIRKYFHGKRHNR